MGRTGEQGRCRVRIRQGAADRGKPNLGENPKVTVDLC